MIIVLIFLVLLVPDLYVWHHLMRHNHWAWQVLYWLPYIATALFMSLVQTPLYQAWMFRCGMTLLLCFSVPKLLFTLVSLLGMAVGRVSPAMARVLDFGGGILAVAALGLMIYGLFVGWKQLTVNEIELTFDDLPEEFDGYRIVHLSDMHVGTYQSAPEMVDSIVNTVNGIDADMICFTGDLVNSDPHELDPFMKAFARLRAKDGVYSIMGNHDYCTYRRVKDKGDSLTVIRDLHERERSFGWRLLLNENVIITRGKDSLMLAGVENSSKPPFPDHGNLPKALAREDGTNALFTILLSHDPTHWQREVLPESAVQLQLSGHTHSTQFKLFGWTPASFTYKEYAGLYEMLKDGTETFNPEQSVADSRKLFVCTGTGGNLPFRVGVTPEIVVIKLRSASVRNR